MNDEKDFLGAFEETVMLAVMKLGEGAYGAKIRQVAAENTGRSISIGAVYATLDRLEQKGFVSSRQGESTPERGGRAKRYVRVEGAGIKAINQTWMARNKLAEGLDLGLGAVGGIQ